MGNNRGEEFKKQYRVNNKKLNTKRVAAVATAGVLTVGGIAVGAKKIMTPDTSENPIKIEEVAKNKSNLEKLGIDEKIVQNIISINEKLNDENITNKELIDLSVDINSLQFDVIKGKIAKTLGEDEEDIKLYSRGESEGKTAQTIEVSGKVYTEKDMFNRKDTIDEKIADYIKEVGSMQTLMQKLQNGDFNRDEVIKEYRDAMDSTEKVAALAEISVDKYGNISMEEVQLTNKKAEKTKVETKNATYTVKTMDDDDGAR